MLKRAATADLMYEPTATCHGGRVLVGTMQANKDKEFHPFPLAAGPAGGRCWGSARSAGPDPSAALAVDRACGAIASSWGW